MTRLPKSLRTTCGKLILKILRIACKSCYKTLFISSSINLFLFKITGPTPFSISLSLISRLRMEMMKMTMKPMAKKTLMSR